MCDTTLRQSPSTCDDGQANRLAGNHPSLLLSVPTEIRLLIYDYCLDEPNAFTISAAPITVFGHKIQDLGRKNEIPGLPLDHAPLVRNHYDPALLSVSTPAQISLDKEEGFNTTVPKLPMPAHMALASTCRMMRDEIQDHVQRHRGGSATTKNLALYVSYPYGVVVLDALYPFLMKHVRNVYISGYYTSSKDAPPHATAMPRIRRSSMIRQNSTIPRPHVRLDPPLKNTDPVLPTHPSTTITHAPNALENLVRTILPRTSAPTSAFQSLEARILYADTKSYNCIWGDLNGPVTNILRNTPGGDITTHATNGRVGSGMVLSVKPKSDGRRMASSWGQNSVKSVAACDEFLIGENWGQ
ncbi:hypothetical protein BS50DRAFT_640361 [Corynespora cassiicola Philippines]|uniref:Uncharacterized protein n=1 Tax=Corynespora cassiicola Philippines TaxID=1448308 RepID=A0A2T2N4D4_CORCC|nr:hypothetical protein BS50DRAFT_640361 [Corynespora cassiicola Philippines]